MESLRRTEQRQLQQTLLGAMEPTAAARRTRGEEWWAAWSRGAIRNAETCAGSGRQRPAALHLRGTAPGRTRVAPVEFEKQTLTGVTVAEREYGLHAQMEDMRPQRIVAAGSHVPILKKGQLERACGIRMSLLWRP
jgi:hypothetical protein